jgi:hypothetical protein
LRGKAYVSIDKNVGRLQVSIPLDAVRWLKGHYINAECAVQSSVSGDPRDARITSLLINGRSLGEEGLTWHQSWWPLRRYILDWSKENNLWSEGNDLKTLEIGDGKVILETKGGE